MVKHANNKNISDNLPDRFPNPYTEGSGSIGFWLGKNVYRLNAEISYWLGEEHWGSGIMTNVIKAIVKYIFKDFDTKKSLCNAFFYQHWINKGSLSNHRETLNLRNALHVN